MKSLLIKPVGGLANRMRVLEAAFNYAKANALPVIVIWEINETLNASYQQCFENMPLARVVNLNYLGKGLIYKVRRRLYTIFVKRILSTLAYIKRTDVEIEDMLGADEDRTCEQRYFDRLANEYGKIYIETCFGFYPNTDKYQLPIRESIVKLSKELFAHNTCNIGLHIRRGDHTEATRESPTEYFIKRIRHTLREHPHFRFYLSTDSDEVVQELRQIFNDRIVTGISVRSRESNEGITSALIDLYCLSRCDEIWGSKASSFSERAALINNIPLKTIADPL